jgi:hypothetical protein
MLVSLAPSLGYDTDHVPPQRPRGEARRLSALFRLRDGSADGVNLSGLTLALALFFPGPTLYDGNATARLYLEERATADQRSALEPKRPGVAE